MPNDTPKPDDNPKFEFLPEPYPMTPEEKAAILAKYEATLSFEEIERLYSKEEEGIPFEKIIEDLEAIRDEIPETQK